MGTQKQYGYLIKVIIIIADIFISTQIAYLLRIFRPSPSYDDPKIVENTFLKLST